MSASLLMIVNRDSFFLSHRLPVAEAARDEGMSVTVMAEDTGHGAEISGCGLRFVPLSINSSGFGSLKDLATLQAIIREYRRSPDAVVHLVGLKVMLLGQIAAQLTGKRGLVNAVSGMGMLFVNPGFKSKLVLRALRLTGRGKGRVGATIFQNDEDRHLFTEAAIPTGEVRHTYGLGINLSDAEYTPYPDESVKRIFFSGRMLESKGVRDLCEAAELLRPRLEGRVRFVLCGAVTDSQDSLTVRELDELCDGEYIEWLGHRGDVHRQLARSVMMVFPSYYREGLPKSLIEASAIGRAIITTDSTGCRDTVEEGRNGYKVEARNPEALSKRILELVEDDEKCMRMGMESRRIAEERYDIRDVIKVHLDIYRKILSRSK